MRIPTNEKPDLVIQGLSPPFRGGMAQYTGDFVDAMRNLGAFRSVRWLAWKTPFPQLLYRGERPEEVPKVHTIPPERVLSFWNPLSWRKGAAVAKDAEIVHLQVNAQLHLAAQIAIAKSVRGLLAGTVHNVKPHDSHEPHLKALMASLCRRLEVIVVHSERVKQGLVSTYGLDSGRIHVVPHPVYTQPTIGAMSPGEARERLGLGADGRVFLFFGAVRRYKGVLELIEAIKRTPDCSLIIAGKCWDYEEEILRAKQDPRLSGRLHCFLRFIDDKELGTFFSAADAVVLPFLSMEGDSGSMKMAQSFRKALIVSDALPDEAGVVARVARRDLVEGLAAALRTISLGSAVYEGILVSWSEHARRVANAYRAAR